MIFFAVPTFAVRETASLGIMGAPKVPPLCRDTQSLGQHMLELSCENATVGTNGISLTMYISVIVRQIKEVE